MSFGANSYLTKPTEFDARQELVNLLASYWLKQNTAPRACCRDV
jgi:hypothetical protein